MAVHAAIAEGMRFKVVRCLEGVLDLSRRGDIAAVVAVECRHYGPSSAGVGTDRGGNSR